MTEKHREEKLQEEMFDIMLRYAAEQAGEEFADEQTECEPVEFSQRHQKEMEKLFKQMEERRPAFFYVKRIAAVFVILVLLTVTSVMGVDAWRAKFLNFFTKPSQTNTEVRYGEEASKGGKHFDEMVTLNYVPEGMRITEERKGKRDVALLFSKGEEFFKLRVSKTVSVSYIDTEDKEIGKVSVNGVDAYLRTANGEHVIKWTFDEKAYTLSGNLDKETLLKIAENIY